MIVPVMRFLLTLVLAAAAGLGATALPADRPSQPLDSPLLADLDGYWRLDRAADRYRRYRTKLVRSQVGQQPGSLPRA